MAGKGVVVVATTNYVRGIDTAIQRSGRFDVKLPVLPPDEADRQRIFEYYLSPPRLKEFNSRQDIDTRRLATEAILFTPADIKTVVQTAARQAIREASSHGPVLSTESLCDVIQHHPRSVRRDMAREWLDEAVDELGHHDKRLMWLGEEIVRAFGRDQ